MKPRYTLREVADEIRQVYQLRVSIQTLAYWRSSGLLGPPSDKRDTKAGLTYYQREIVHTYVRLRQAGYTKKGARLEVTGRTGRDSSDAGYRVRRSFYK